MNEKSFIPPRFPLGPPPPTAVLRIARCVAAMFVHDERDRITELRHSPANRYGEPWEEWLDAVASGGFGPDRDGKSVRRIMSCEQLWMLKSFLDDPAESERVAQERKAG